MFQLYKKRGFSDYLNDTFAFLKAAGGHFIKNYAIMCGGLLLLSLVLGVVIFKSYIQFFQGAMGGDTSIENIFNGNIILFAGLFLFFIILLIVLSIVSYLFPVVYMRLYEENGNFSFTSASIGSMLRKNVGRSLKFSLLTILFSLVVGILVLALLVLLCVTIIGIPFAVIGLFALSGIYNVAFFTYMNNHEIGYIDAFKTAFEFVKNNLWPVVGANFVMVILITIIGSIFSMIPMIIGMVGLVAGTGEGSVDSESSKMFLITMGISYGLSFLVQFILNNLMILMNGMIYYTMQDTNHNFHSKSEIDLIGAESES